MACDNAVPTVLQSLYFWVLSSMNKDGTLELPQIPNEPSSSEIPAHYNDDPRYVTVDESPSDNEDFPPLPYGETFPTQEPWVEATPPPPEIGTLIWKRQLAAWKATRREFLPSHASPHITTEGRILAAPAPVMDDDEFEL